MTARKTHKSMGTAHSPRTTWTLWRSPSSHIEAWAAAIWRKTSLGRRGQRVGEQRCHNSERNGWLLLCWQPAGTVSENYNSSELDRSGCPTTGSDATCRRRHRRAASCFPTWRLSRGIWRNLPRVTTHLAGVSSPSRTCLLFCPQPAGPHQCRARVATDARRPAGFAPVCLVLALSNWELTAKVSSLSLRNARPRFTQFLILYLHLPYLTSRENYDQTKQQLKGSKTTDVWFFHWYKKIFFSATYYVTPAL